MKQPKYLLDTCICICWLRDKFNVKSRINAVGLENCCISEITVAELKFGKADTGWYANWRFRFADRLYCGKP